MLDLKISFTLSILTIARSGAPAPTGEPHKLSIPWQEKLQEAANVASLLSWRTYLSDFVGFDHQMDELREWAMSPPQVSLKFMVGEGGTGKTRSAAEFARSLQGRNKWAAGFVDLRKPQSYDLSKKGNLLVVDYPEEQQSAVAELLTDLAGLGSDCPRLRVLLLTRRSIEHWYDVVTDSKANAVVDMKPVVAQGLTASDAYKVFCSAQDGAAKHLKTTPVPVSEEQLDAWLRLTTENDRALFVVAAAVHSAVNPDDLVVQYSGSQVVQSIAEREVAGLRNASKGAALKEDYALARVVAIAAVAGSITEAAVLKMAKESPDLLGLDQGEDIRKALRLITAMPERLVPAPKPDILAAAMVVRILSDAPETAAELIWLGVEQDVPNGLNRFARLSYDAEIVLDLRQHRISDWLAEAVKGRNERCEMLRPYFSQRSLPMGWTSAAIAMWQTLLDSHVGEEDRAGMLNNLSVCLSDKGDDTKALEAIREAVTMRRVLAEAEPARYEPDLAASLSNLSVCLNAVGDAAGALEAMREAVKIDRRMAEAEPAEYEPALAGSLDNLSNHLSAVGDDGGALEASRESVDLYRHLVARQPTGHEPGLAMSLDNLSSHLSAIGKGEGALEASRASVDIYRRLAEDHPARYEPDLARSLINLSNRLGAVHNNTEGLETSRECMEICRRLADAQPTRYERDFAVSLSVVSIHLSATDDVTGALAATRESTEIFYRLTKAQPDTFEPRLAEMLNQLSNQLSAAGDKLRALEAIREAVEIRRRLAEDHPARYEPDLAGSLNNLSNRLSESGANEKALEAIRESVEICRRLADAEPGRNEPILAMSLNNMSNRLIALGDKEGALGAVREAASLYRRLAEAHPARYEPYLAWSLANLGLVLKKSDQHENGNAALEEATKLLRPHAKQWPGSRHMKLLRDIESMLKS